MECEGRMEKEQKSCWLTDPGNVLLVTYILINLFLLVLGSLEVSWASEATDMNGSLSMDEVRGGELLLPVNKQNQFARSPLLSQDVHIVVSGIVARVRVTQQFVNRSDGWVEAVYVFPLPDESAVDRLRMKVGDRVVVGEIREKGAARAVYEKAKREGRKSSLLVGNRPNIFTTNVANIGPGETIDIEIEYQQIIRYDNRVFSLRFPMVVGPRYIPGQALTGDNRQIQQFSSTGWSVNTDQVRDASEITPPVVQPGEGKIHPVQLSVELAAGFPLARIESLYHGVDILETKENLYSIIFNQKVFADRDFVLEYQPESNSAPQGALFTEGKAGENHMLLMLMPPEPDENEQQIPRELIFVIDTSGSMAGPSLRQAKEALVMAISRLHSYDRFNVIEFNSHARSIFSSVRPGDPRSVRDAVDFVRSLKSEGGTEIASALSLALDGKKDHERIRQIVFLTDGAVGNEEALFSMITSRLGDSRLFTVGIGSAPNSFFMTRAAVMGRGAYTYIGKIDEVAAKMKRLFRKLESPVLTSLKIQGLGGGNRELEIFPSPLPDLYAGEPFTALIRADREMASLKVTGVLSQKPWSQLLNVQTNNKNPGVAALWARKKIRNLMESLYRGADKSKIRQMVVQTALQYQLVSKYTSLVAVDQKISRPPSENVNKVALKTNMPAGWQHNKVFGGTARTATPSRLYLVIGFVLCVAALFLLRRERIFST